VRRFPVGLTLAALAVFTILIGLGLWQLRRLEETNQHRARLAALVNAPPQPLGPLLARSARDDLDHTRISVRCGPPAGSAPVTYRYSLAGGQLGWRLLTLCRLSETRFDSILIDRGRVAALDGATDPRPLAFAAPQAVNGVLRSLGGATMFGDEMPSASAQVRLVRVVDAQAISAMARLAGAKTPAPYYVVVESETPAPAGVAPSPVAEDVPRDNFQYALTWFGLAAALAWVYAAMVWRRLKGQ
jgi:surfeit locus 1 family protein